MKAKKVTIIFAIIVSVVLGMSMLASLAFAEDDSAEQAEKVLKTETEAEASDKAEASAGVDVGADSKASADVDVSATSGTNNIVGDVFSNMFNSLDDPEMDLLREKSLKEYPLDNHELSYYGDSLRVRHIIDGGRVTSNYLVYRDSYLIISKEDSEGYETSFSEDGLTAYVTPAITADELKDKIGIVFLSDDLGDDNILVFDGAPQIEEEVLAVPLKKTEELTVNMLFSDGELAVNEQPKRTMLKASGDDFNIDVELAPDVSGTNWKASIDNFSPKWPSKPGATVDVFDLLFEVHINLKFSLDYEITTTGATGERETKTIAGFTIPLGPFSVTMDYNLQVEFDETPIKVKGKMTTDFDYGLGTHGATIKKYRTEVTVSELTVNPNDPDDFNKDIDFYIGSQIEIKGEFLKLTINLGFWKKTFGPVLKIAQESEGGSYVKTRHDKDQFDLPSGADKIRPSHIEGDKIHTCAKHGEAGCLCLEIRETYKHKIYLKINLYFKKWEPKLAGNDEEKEIGTTNYHRSYTFGDTKILKGYCPHIFYRVPVNVWEDEYMRDHAPAGIEVTVGNAPQVLPEEEGLIVNETDDNGKATLFLPYQDEHSYHCVASGEIDGVNVSGSQWTVYIQKGLNPPVDIILESVDRMTVSAKVSWIADVNNNDIPTSNDTLMLILFGRKVGTNDKWEDIEERITDKARNWNVDDWTPPKFGFKDGKAFLYEYRVRIMERHIGSGGYDVITPEEGNLYIDRLVDAYDDAAGAAEQSHYTKYYVTNEDSIDKSTGDVLTEITARAVVDIDVNKKWKVADPESRPESVYLALQQKPEKGWENIADANRVPQEWVAVLDPVSGDLSTLSELEDEEILTTADYIDSIDDVPLSIGKANDDNEWKLSYTVPKYCSGVLMQHKGTELDSEVIESLLRNEYDYITSASVKPFGDFASVDGLALNDRDYKKTADVVNLDPLSPNTIVGTVRWQTFWGWWNIVPDRVKLDIFKDGEKIDDITLDRDDYDDDDIWIWTRTLDAENYDPDAEYTVEETFSNGSKEWVGIVTGLDVYNYHAEFNLQVEAQAVFDYEPSGDDYHVTIRDRETSEPAWNLNLKRRDGWWDRVSVEDIYSVKDVSEYEMDAPDIPGYVKTYGKPYAYTRPGWGNLFYNYTVYYVRQSDDLTLHIRKDWTNTDASTDYPDEVSVKVHRDNELIAEETIKKNLLTGEWDEAIISEDPAGNRLKRVSSSGHKYIYTITEEPVDGFTSSVAVTEDGGGDDITYTITNRWVGEDYVNVRGKITWDDDEHAQLRPETVSLSVIDSTEKEVKTIKVPVNGDNTYEAKYLPGKDSKGNALKYSVLESHVKGYTAIYAEPEFDEEAKTWKCDITNKLTGYFPLNIKKTVKGTHKGEDDTFEFEVADAEGDKTPERNAPLPINVEDLKIRGAGELAAQFIIDNDGVYFYSVKEKKGNNKECTYDDTKKLVMIARTTDDKHNTSFQSWVTDDDGSGSAIDMIDYAESGTEYDGWDDPSEEDTEVDELDKLKSDTVEFINRYADLKVEKKWDIDLEGKDRPDSIQVLVQKKDKDKWESVSLVELNEDNDWKSNVTIEGEENRDGDKAEYRVRELKEETALQELAGKIKDLVKQGKDKYDEWINTIKTEGKSYWDALPQDIRNAADKGYDSLIDKLNTTPNKLYDKLMEKLAIASAEKRIVYDKDDSDKNGDTNEVTYHVDEYTSVVTGGEEDSHITKYKVDYSKDDDTYTIKDTAIIEIDEYKRWISFGVDDDDMPDSVWMVLMARPKAGALDNAKTLAGSAGIDISGVLSYEFPLIDPMEGGMDPLKMLGEMTLGIDLGFISDMAGKIFKVNIPKIAVGKTDADSDWKLEFVDKKYKKGIPMEYKGAELSSEIIRQVIKYLIQVDIPVSFNPFDKYVSIPTKAVKSIEGIEQPSDLLDLSKLSGAALEKAKKLTMDDIKNFGWSTLFTDYHLMANVINIKADWDSEDDPEKVTVEGKKTWRDNKNEAGARPDSITIRLKANGKIVKGLSGMDEDGGFKVTADNDWKWKFEDLDKEDEDGKEISYTITEDRVEGYTSSIDGYNVINTYTPNKTQINVDKIWDDGNNADGIRPESVTIQLWKQGEEELSEGDKTQVTDESGNPVTLILNRDNNWTGSFIGLDRDDENGNEIIYTVKEEDFDDESYTSDLTGDLDIGFTFTNSHTPENVFISGRKIWNDNNDEDRIRPETIIVHLMNGNDSVAQIETSEEAGWKYHFPPQPVKDEQGNEIVYSVEEEYPEDYEYADKYTSEKDGCDIINTHEPNPEDRLYIITYKLNDGVYNGSTKKIVEKYKGGTVISIHEAPSKEGYKFLYWKGSEYQPGDKYTVTSDHTFEAQWEEDTGNPDPDDPDPDNPDPDNPDPDNPDPDNPDPDDPDPDNPDPDNPDPDEPEPDNPNPDDPDPDDPDPDNPDPDNPDPGEPDKPDNPGEPDDPDKPDNPDEPDGPDKPNDSDEPDNPGEPGNPDKPDNPNEPKDPDEPEDPGTPARNTDTGDRSDFVLWLFILLTAAGIIAVLNYQKSNR